MFIINSLFTAPSAEAPSKVMEDSSSALSSSSAEGLPGPSAEDLADGPACEVVDFSSGLPGPSTEDLVADAPADEVGDIAFFGCYQPKLEPKTEPESEPEDAVEELAQEEGDDKAGDDDEDEVEDEEAGDDEDEVEDSEAEEQAPKAKVTLPGKDNDPDEAPTGSAVNKDRHKWTRTLKKVVTVPFSGPKPNGPTFPKLNRPLDYFLQFFSLSLFTFIAKMTSINLVCKGLTDTTDREIRAWFGIRVLMGVVCLRNIDHYWSDKPGLRNELISSTMTRKRFDELSSCLACSDPLTDPVDMPNETTYKQRQDQFNYIRSHPLFYIQKLWDAVKDNCVNKYKCLRELAIDVAMIPYGGFKAWPKKLIMSSKPTRSGFKVYALAESLTGYMANFMIHVPTASPQKYKDIAMKVASTHVDRHHHIFTDRLYTCRDLASELLESQTYLTGAIKTNSARLPVDLSNNPMLNKDNLVHVINIKKTQRGTFYSRQAGQLTYSMWNGSSLLSILSSGHSGFRNKENDYIMKTLQSVPTPPAVIDYYKFMGGVDLSDQLRNYHQINRKARDWWKQILYFLVDICRVNAWISYKHHYEIQDDDSNDDSDDDSNGSDDETTSTKMTHTMFTVSIAEALIGGYSHGRKTKQTAAGPVLIENFDGNHVLEKLTHPLESKYPRMCKMCATEKKKTPRGGPVKTSFGCRGCAVFLCPGFCFSR